MTNNALLTIPQAAQVAGLSGWRIRAAIESQALPAVDVGQGLRRHHRVAPQDLDTFVRQLRAGEGRADRR